MPERLMGTDCKFVGEMSTLVQIQLGPKIRRSMKKIDLTSESLGGLFRPDKKEKIVSKVVSLFVLYLQLISKKKKNILKKKESNSEPHSHYYIIIRMRFRFFSSKKFSFLYK